MSIILDKQYANMIASRLEGFKWSRGNLAICKCPVCGDSAKKKSKRRFYIYRNTRGGLKDYLSVHCHNCQYQSPFGKFLKDFDSGLYGQYRMDLFKEMGWGKRQEAPEEIEEETEPEVFTDAIDGCVSLLELPEDHPCIQYVMARMIPKDQWGRLWYAENFKAAMVDFAEGDGEEDPTENLPEDSRLILPFKNEYGSVTCIQGRALGDSQMRYITIKQRPDSSKVFGLDVVDKSKPIYVVEGPIDSLFLPNCVAVADSHLCGFTEGSVFVHDNQPRNRSVCKQIEASIMTGKKVVLWPSWLEEKDVNDIYKAGVDLMGLISAYSFQGLRAKMEFAKWKRF